MPKFGFTDNDGADVGSKYLTKEHAIESYPNIFTNANMPSILGSGSNNVGQLGDGTITNKSVLGYVSGFGTNWRQVSTSALNSGAVKSDGTLWTWGDGTYGSLGHNLTSNRSSPATTSGGGTDWAAISTAHSSEFMMGLKTSGLIYSWGRNNNGQLGTGNTTNRSSPQTIVGGISDWTTIACGYRASAAIRSSGLLYTWGLNSSGQLGSGSTTNRSSPATTSGGGTTWTSVSMGRSHAAATKSDGSLWTWGNNASGQLGNASTTNRSSPGQVAGTNANWKKISCSDGSTTAGVKTDGSLWTWGDGNLGILGNGGEVDRSSPGTTSGGGLNWNIVSLGTFAAAAIKTDGTLWTWGYNVSGELATNDIVSRSSPGTTSVGGTYWKSVDAGNGTLFAIKEEDNW